MSDDHLLLLLGLHDVPQFAGWQPGGPEQCGVRHGRITGMTVNGVSRTFGYDDTYQLTSDNGNSLTYDANGNRTLSCYVLIEGLTNGGFGNEIDRSISSEYWSCR